MAGMFYSLQEAAAKLNKTEEQIRELAREGKLREFRDGPNVLFKVDEIDALISDESAAQPEDEAELKIAEDQQAPEEEAPAQDESEMPELEVEEPEEPKAQAEEEKAEEKEPQEDELEIPELEVEQAGQPKAEASEEKPAEEAPEQEELDLEISDLEEAEEPKAEAEEQEKPAEEATEEEELDFEIPDLEVEEAEEAKAEAPEQEKSKEESPQAEAPEPQEQEGEEVELGIPEEEEEAGEKAEEEEKKLAPADEAMGTSEILLAPESGAPAAPSELTDADTALTGEGINVLGESESGYEITDDTLAETAMPSGTSGTGPEMPLEEIEGDVNLDSFGSGSGLLDLSLQADDTSLGGILDEIYTDEVEGKGAAVEEPAAAEPAEAVAAEAGEAPTEEAPVVAEGAGPDVSMALARPLVEAPPDMASNTLGMLLFLPLLVVIYTIVVAVAGEKGVTPSIVTGIQAFIWYIMGGAAVVSLIVAGVAFMAGGGGGGATKVKKAKAPKAKKEKKPKKEKKKKEPKAKKEKKPKKEKKKKKKG
jgi:excisionase family DNA binding protein